MHSRACSGEHTNRLDIERTRCGIRNPLEMKWANDAKVLHWKVTCLQNAFLRQRASFVGSYLSCDVRHTATTQSSKLICWRPADLGRHAQVRHWAFVYCFVREEAAPTPDSSTASRVSLRTSHPAFIFRTGRALRQIFPSTLAYANDGRKLLQNWVQFVGDDCRVVHGPSSRGRLEAGRSKRSKTRAYISAPFKG